MFLLVFLGFVLEGIIYEKSGKNMDLIETSKISTKIQARKLEQQNSKIKQLEDEIQQLKTVKKIENLAPKIFTKIKAKKL